MLSLRNLILSRQDIYFGDDHTFNATIWNPVAAWFTNCTISLSTAIAARAARLVAAAAVNPEFDMSASDVEFSGIETALCMTVFADPEAASEARREWVSVLFGE
jgi:Peroxidase, family 2